eukprot:CAMPEP_0182421464 /NCGR_PEP_ID=MMETSP1167-20130531/6881_1 /TAXON_ID=2988 /ORGANISM="Mallomonas Sp, Strain CCMP3275" /LENGTH=311 /DNA_ID=CAMNT_0024598645 /DNA_START=148 /DNA_END=1083 /DNA_ORIENTATION=-
MTSDQLEVRVVDSGAGISKENISKVFNDIVQFSPGKLQQGGGSGLGLWISRKIVDLHDGTVSVSSEGEGYGCCFTLELPIHEYFGEGRRESRSTRVSPCPSPQDNPDSLRTASPLSHTDLSMSMDQLADQSLSQTNKKNTNQLDTIFQNSRRTSPLCQHDVNNDPIASNTTASDTPNLLTRTSLRLMVVDDAVVTRKMICRGLKTRGYQDIMEAEDGQDALTQLMRSVMEEVSPSVQAVLMDYQMPHMDGPTAARRMRENGYKGVIIGVTGNALPADIHRFITNGADSVLTKPVGIEMLDNEILTRCSHRN